MKTLLAQKDPSCVCLWSLHVPSHRFSGLLHTTFPCCLFNSLPPGQRGTEGSFFFPLLTSEIIPKASRYRSRPAKEHSQL